MKKRFMQFVLVVLAAALLLPRLSTGAEAAGGNQTVRVGLFYGDNALAAPQLLNSEGVGYRFGYFDDGLNFISLGSTAETAITMQPAAACVQLPGSYATFAEASAAAMAVGGFPAWVNGAYCVRQASGAGGTLVTPGGNAVSVYKTDTSSILFQFDGEEQLSLAVKPGQDDSVRTTTWFKGYKYYGAFQYQRLNGGNLTVCNVLPLEDYLKGVVSNEMSDSWPLEALKAQAVCARTYAHIKLNGGKHRGQGFDLCNTIDCQVYGGLNTAGSNSDRAVEETAGVCIWSNGVLVEANYFSSDGGATESSENVWNNALPHLRGVNDPYETAIADQIDAAYRTLGFGYRWTKTFTRAELTNLLRSNNYQCADVVDFRVSQTTPTGNVLMVTVVDAAGKSWPFTKEKARTFFGLYSQRFSVTGGAGNVAAGCAVTGGGTLDTVAGAYAIDGTGAVSAVTGAPYLVTASGVSPLASGSSGGGDVFTVSGSGWGHGVGMSQWGANAMAKQGFTYRQILEFYFTGIEVR